MRRTNVKLVIESLEQLERATTNEIISYIQKQGIKSAPPRVISQICSCLPVVKKDGMRGAYVVWKLDKEKYKKYKKDHEF